MNCLRILVFNVAWRWSDTYLWEASFGDGVIPKISYFRCYGNYRIPKLKSTLKLGGTNLIGDEYFTAFWNRIYRFNVLCVIDYKLRNNLNYFYKTALKLSAVLVG